MRNITEHANQDVQKMLIGNKCDISEKRIVTKERGMDMAQHYRIPFLETSAKDNVNVEEMFYNMATYILDKMDSDATGVKHNYEGNSTSSVKIGMDKTSVGKQIQSLCQCQ